MRALALIASMLCACPDDPTAIAPPAAKQKERLPAAKMVTPNGIVPTTSRPPNPFEEHGPPEFVKRGSGVFEDHGKRYFYGAGKAKGIDNMMRAHLLADKAANAELNNQLRKYNQRAIDVMGFEIRTKADNFAVAEVEKAEIVDHWIDHDGDEWHSLRRIDAQAYADGLAKVLGMTEEVRAKIGQP